ncbi:AAA family ATPase [Micromonospora purpureochromogenes]|uniref:AAA family ATPase n=1 Tax=Micromonospora purpureochromogenes TaxID=47872 RepID=UPI0033EBAB17
MTPAIDRVLDALRDTTGLVRQSGGQWQARCPAHEDRNPSLSVRPIEGTVLVHCHAGCHLVDVLAALNMTPRDLYDEPRDNELTRYRYTDAAGNPTREVVRYEGKQFKQYGDKKQCQLYRLPKVMEAATFGRTVYLVEGEKDVHAVESLGEVATTAPQGADNFAKVDVSPLKGARVVAVVDRDAAGEKWAEQVRKRLDGFAAELVLVEAAEGKDAADHIAAGHPLDALVPVEAKPTGRRLVLTSAADIEPEPVVWAWEDDPDDLLSNTGRIPLGSLSIAAGREGTGKSSFGIWMAAKITRGELPGSLYGKPMAVIYAAVEDSWKHTLVPRLIAAGADLTKVYRVEVVEDEHDGLTLSLPTDNSLLERELKRVGAALLVLDPLMSTIGAGIDTHRERDVRVALDPLARLADRARVVVLGIAHFNKGASNDPSSLITGSGAFKNVPRSVFGFAVDPEGDRVMTQTKNSLGRLDLPSLAYQIQGTEVPTKHGPAHVGQLVWLGQSDRSVTDILSERGDAEDQGDRKDAADWLTGYLADNGGEASAVDVFKAGDKDGFSKDALKRAKRRAGVISEKGGMDAGWMWRLKPSEGSEGSEGSKGADGREPAPFALPSDPDTTKGAPKGAPSRELRSSLPSLPSLPSEPGTPHSWWMGSNRPEHPDCLACRAMRPGESA